MNIFEFIEDFDLEDLFDADKRRKLEQARSIIARFHFEDLLEKDFSSLASLFNAKYYEMATNKLNMQVS